jgi:hypothetical protein
MPVLTAEGHHGSMASARCHGSAIPSAWLIRDLNQEYLDSVAELGVLTPTRIILTGGEVSSRLASMRKAPGKG